MTWIQQLLADEYNDFEDLILIESKFQHIYYPSGRRIRFLYVAMSSENIYMARRVGDKNNEHHPHFLEKRARYDARYDDIEGLEMMKILPLTFVHIFVYQEKNHVLALGMYNQTTMFLALAEPLNADLVWSEWLSQIRLNRILNSQSTTSLDPDMPPSSLTQKFKNVLQQIHDIPQSLRNDEPVNLHVGSFIHDVGHHVGQKLDKFSTGVKKARRRLTQAFHGPLFESPAAKARREGNYQVIKIRSSTFRSDSDESDESIIDSVNCSNRSSSISEESYVDHDVGIIFGVQPLFANPWGNSNWRNCISVHTINVLDNHDWLWRTSNPNLKRRTVYNSLPNLLEGQARFLKEKSDQQLSVVSTPAITVTSEPDIKTGLTETITLLRDCQSIVWKYFEASESEDFRHRQISDLRHHQTDLFFTVKKHGVMQGHEGNKVAHVLRSGHQGKKQLPVHSSSEDSITDLVRAVTEEKKKGKKKSKKGTLFKSPFKKPSSTSSLQNLKNKLLSKKQPSKGIKMNGQTKPGEEPRTRQQEYLEKILDHNLQEMLNNVDFEMCHRASYEFSREAAESLIPIHDIDADSLARELTLIDKELLVRIQDSELVDCVWTKVDKERKAPNIMIMITFFERVANLVASEILKQETPLDRAKMVVKFILVAEKCRQLKNFNSLRAVLGGLQITPIFRLDQTWDQVRSKYSKRNRLYRELCELMGHEHNFVKYKKALDKAMEKPPCLPFLGVFLHTVLAVHTVRCLNGEESEEREAPCAPPQDPSTAHPVWTSLLVRERHDVVLAPEDYDKRFNPKVLLFKYQMAAIQYTFQSKPDIRKYLLKAYYNTDEENFRISCEKEPAIITRERTKTM